MRLFSSLFLLCTLFLSGCNAGKIGVIDMNAVMTQSVQAKNAQKEVLEVQKIYQHNLTVIEKKLATYKNKEKAKNYLGQAAQQLQKQLQASQAGINQALANALSEVISEQTKEYSLVMNKAMLINSDESLDITQSIITEFDKASVNYPPRPQKVNNPKLPADK